METRISLHRSTKLTSIRNAASDAAFLLGATERVSALELDPAAGYRYEEREGIRHEQMNEQRTNEQLTLDCPTSMGGLVLCGGYSER